MRLAVLVALAGLALAALLGGRWLTRGGLPQRSGTASVDALDGPVGVLFDDAGVPHVTAGSPHDLAVALGYLHANDRMTQLELGRRLAAGRLAEVVGEAGLVSDRHFVQLGMRHYARTAVAALGTESRALIEAYAAGVNAWLAARGADLPPGLRILGVRPEPWQPVDSIYFQLQMAYQLSFFEGRPEEDRYEALRRLGPERLLDLFEAPAPEIPAEILAQAALPDPQTLALVPPPARLSRGAGAALGSNSWALAADRTSTGRPLVANDPHLPLALPSLWYQATLRSPDYSAAGVTLPGFPLVVLGQGRDVAWAFTNVMLDDHDIFFEQPDPDLVRVRRGDDWLDLTIEDETIRVADGAPLTVPVRFTDLGVLLPAEPDRGLPARSLAWTAAYRGDLATVPLTLARARRVEELIGRLEQYVAPAQNLVAADRHGGLLFTAIGRVPHRGAGDGRFPAPAWLPGYQWRGLYPQKSNRTVLAPDSGLIVTANHRIAGSTAADRAPYPAAEFDSPHRAERILELLRARRDWTLEDLATVQTDVRSRYARELVALLDDEPYAGAAGRALALLLSWGGSMNGNGAPALFTLLERRLGDEIFDETAGLFVGRLTARRRLLHVLRGGASPEWFDRLDTPAVERRHDVLGAALAAAWREAEARWGVSPESWSYGDTHRLLLEHPLGGVPVLGRWFNRGPYPYPGSETTVAAFGTGSGPDRERIAYGPSMRWISAPGAPDRARAILPTGQSGHPADAHYDDQFGRYRRGELRPVYWSQEAAEAAAVSRLRLAPARRAPATNR